MICNLTVIKRFDRDREDASAITSFDHDFVFWLRFRVLTAISQFDLKKQNDPDYAFWLLLWITNTITRFDCDLQFDCDYAFWPWFNFWMQFCILTVIFQFDHENAIWPRFRVMPQFCFLNVIVHFDRNYEFWLGFCVFDCDYPIWLRPLFQPPTLVFNNFFLVFSGYGLAYFGRIDTRPHCSKRSLWTPA